MSNHKLKEVRTNTDNLISNLRGEVGEIITSWVLLRDFLPFSTFTDEDLKDPEKLFDPHKIRIRILVDRLKSDIVARLYELSKDKIGRLNFYFAEVKLKIQIEGLSQFEEYLIQNKFREKRDTEISHKELPEQWGDHKLMHIPNRKIVKALAMALAIMKKIDETHLGPKSKYLWHEMRKKRYKPTNPPSAGYLLLPYLKLSNEARFKVMNEEQKSGKVIWEEIETKINGEESKILVCKEWGAVLLGNRILFLEAYPLQGLESLEFTAHTNFPTSAT